LHWTPAQRGKIWVRTFRQMAAVGRCKAGAVSGMLQVVSVSNRRPRRGNL
jgi:hypothetical protein